MPQQVEHINLCIIWWVSSDGRKEISTTQQSEISFIPLNLYPADFNLYYNCNTIFRILKFCFRGQRMCTRERWNRKQSLSLSFSHIKPILALHFSGNCFRFMAIWLNLVASSTYMVVSEIPRRSQCDVCVCVCLCVHIFGTGSFVRFWGPALKSKAFQWTRWKFSRVTRMNERESKRENKDIYCDCKLLCIHTHTVKLTAIAEAGKKCISKWYWKWKMFHSTECTLRMHGKCASVFAFKLWMSFHHIKTNF